MAWTLKGLFAQDQEYNTTLKYFAVENLLNVKTIIQGKVQRITY